MEWNKREDVLIFAPSGDLNFKNANEFKNEVRKNFGPTDRFIILNLEKLDFIDSSGIGAIISLMKTTQERSGKIVLCGASPKVMYVLNVTKLNQIMEIKNALHEANAWIAEIKKSEKC